MFQFAEKKSPDAKDAAEFIRLVNDLPPDLRGFFDSSGEIFVARAPGRMDVMGGIADYSGSLVLEMPIAEATFAALQKSVDENLKIISLSGNESLIFEMPLADLLQNGKPILYETARRYFAENRENHWASYVAGVFLTLMRERGANFQSGARLLIFSNIPPGKGVSSSAALEAATMQAVCAAFQIKIEPRETALLCQKTENLIVGAPCGVMDQMTVVCGEENRLLALLCQPAEMLETIDIPEEIEFWGIDSGVRHAVCGADYASVRIGAFIGYRIIAELAGLKTKVAGNNLLEIEDSRWNGYLSNISPSEYEQYFAAHLPEKIGGAEFTRKYRGTTDAVTNVDAEKVYAVKTPTAHAIYENFRVRLFAELLKKPIGETNLKLLGELMFQSHASYAACGLCETGTNRLVELVRENESKTLFGAKITGGGSGGTVAIMAGKNDSGTEAIEEIAQKYAIQSGLKPYIFRGSSKGAAAFGILKLINNW